MGLARGFTLGRKIRSGKLHIRYGTPGPWVIRDGSFIDAPTMMNVANVPAAHIADNFECHPNAKLIAAAPELLEALKQCAAQFSFYAEEHLRLKKMEKYQTNYDYSTMCRTAIAKAKGAS
jgi:hypothetical protein